MNKEREALKALIHEMEYVLSCINAEEIPFDGDDFHEALRLGKEALDHLAQPKQEKERCVGCEACIDTACGRDECPKGWPKAAQPEQEPVAWMREDEMKAMTSLEKDAWVKSGKIDLVKDYNKPLGYLSEGGAERLITKKQTNVPIRNFKLFTHDVPVYTTPPQRTWVGLTWEEIDECFKITPDQYLPAQIYRRIEDKLKEKNT